MFRSLVSGLLSSTIPGQSQVLGLEFLASIEHPPTTFHSMSSMTTHRSTMGVHLAVHGPTNLAL